MWFNSENVSKPVIKIRAVPWVPFPRKAQDKAFHSPHAVTRKLPWWVGGTKLSFKHTPGSDTPSCHCRVASGACSDLAPMLCPHNTAEHQAKIPPGTPAWLSTQARTPHHTPSDIGLPQVPLLSWVQGFWTSCFLLFSSHWHQWTLGQTPGFLVETGHIAQSTSTHLKKFLVSPQTDLPEIKGKFQQMYKKSLTEAVRSDTSGDFRKLLLAILH